MSTDPTRTTGELLKQGRLRQRLSIAECSKRTHIAPRYIEALEEERWNDLPSESHRLGFLRLYSRFLGVSSEEVLKLYQTKTPAAPRPQDSTAKLAARGPSRPASPSQTARRWAPSSVPQLIGLAILSLLLAWVVYHVVNPRGVETSVAPWGRRPRMQQSRLVVPKLAFSAQKVRVQALADSWLRVTSRSELLFEGILPAGSAKFWSGPGPFQFKIGNIRAIALFWNEQPVDLLAGAQGATNTIRIPPH